MPESGLFWSPWRLSAGGAGFSRAASGRPFGTTNGIRIMGFGCLARAPQACAIEIARLRRSLARSLARSRVRVRFSEGEKALTQK